jgi:hypothetical protein
MVQQGTKVAQDLGICHFWDSNITHMPNPARPVMHCDVTIEQNKQLLQRAQLFPRGIALTVRNRLEILDEFYPELTGVAGIGGRLRPAD